MDVLTQSIRFFRIHLSGCKLIGYQYMCSSVSNEQAKRTCIFHNFIMVYLWDLASLLDGLIQENMILNDSFFCMDSFFYPQQKGIFSSCTKHFKVVQYSAAYPISLPLANCYALQIEINFRSSSLSKESQ